MRFLNFLFFTFLIFCGCDELSFTNADTQGKGLIDSKAKTTETTPDTIQDSSNEIEQTSPTPEKKEPPPENKIPDEIPEEKTTLISENMELTKDTVIQNRKVVLDMITIKTFEYNLVIIAEEFLSNHSVIQNFPEEQEARRTHHGRNGGNIQIETETARGELQLILNGEKGGFISRFRHLTKREKKELKGHDGENGYNAVYKPFCLLVPASSSALANALFPSATKKCWYKCAAFPTAGDPGGDGRPGLPGYDGKNGGDSGSFYLKAFELSDFHLTDIKNIPGTGSEGSKGSPGGAGGRGGKNGKDDRDLCNDDLPRRRQDGERGPRGDWGKDGKNGKKGTICLERLFKEKPLSPEDENLRKESVICY